MSKETDTYGKSIQLGASRRRLEDAKALHDKQRWNGAIYMGGYAIECALKSLICFEDEVYNFKDTRTFKKGFKGSNLHSLVKLLEAVPRVQKAIAISNHYQTAWNTISSLWLNDELRYSDKEGNKEESKKFIDAVEKLHQFLLSKQGQ